MVLGFRVSRSAPPTPHWQLQPLLWQHMPLSQDSRKPQAGKTEGLAHSRHSERPRGQDAPGSSWESPPKALLECHLFVCRLCGGLQGRIRGLIQRSQVYALKVPVSESPLLTPRERPPPAQNAPAPDLQLRDSTPSFKAKGGGRGGGLGWRNSVVSWTVIKMFEKPLFDVCTTLLIN